MSHSHEHGAHSNCNHNHTNNFTMPTHEVQNEFVHLHVHTEYSLLDGINKVTRLPEQIKAMNQPAVAMTDHGNLFGAIDFYNAMRNEGIKPIIGINKSKASRRLLPISFNLLQTFAIFITERIIIRIGMN